MKSSSCRQPKRGPDSFISAVKAVVLQGAASTWEKHRDQMCGLGKGMEMTEPQPGQWCSRDLGTKEQDAVLA